MVRTFGNTIIKTIFPILLVVFFWQTRISLGNGDALYDYLIPFAYLSSILMVVLFIGHTFIDHSWIQKSWKISPYMVAAAVGYFVVVGWVILDRGIDTIAGWYWLINFIIICRFSLWMWHVREKYPTPYIMSVLSAGLIPLVGIGLLEIILGKSIGLQFMGEWQFSMHSLGVSTAHIFGMDFLRPYATFPHPNVFGGVMAVFSLYWIYQWLQKRLRDESINTALFFVALFIGGTIISWSLTAILALMIGLIYYIPLLKKLGTQNKLTKTEYALGTLVILVGGSLIAYYVMQLFISDSISFLRRWYLNDVGISIIRKYPFLGVGVSQSILYVSEYWNNAKLPQFTQPIHNVWILLCAESGIVGMGLLLISGYFAILRRWKYLPLYIKAMWLALVVISLSDHYLITLQSGLLLLFLTVGLSLRYDEHSETTSDHF
ncbi:hypothetical protein COX05_01080 [candidate division WWE3 bacterium CG22_combo_CG10-13_8_21_14_all_39_12]|uniref:O-antigen ligase-related domain-containing protein n=1 Tax=candidate division WWE3 bacterium CG22_combo_CG10-13_8_21_14_all_39_12 TaxID=1975094 RepID=A0A2H0BGN4_UNCKA|nr:MAG: hypothetical protein COX05_01080 [candidate division WWE3 bacterium CG22_combo_CG10-13_8_21_14_all_39_12]